MIATSSLAVVHLLALLTGCSSTGETVELPDWTPGFPPEGGDTGAVSDTGVVVAPGGAVGVTVDLGEIATRFGDADDSSLSCEIDTEAQPYAVAACQLDINELDLYFHGWQYDVQVPSGTCEYMRMQHYMYEAWQVGNGPATVEIQVDTEGNFVADGDGALNGEPYCEFDYTNANNPLGDPNNPEAPNCCYGTYTLNIVTVDGTGTPIETTTIPGEEWGGGQLGACYAGAAYSASPTVTDPVSGLPGVVVVDIDENIDSIVSASFPGPIDKPESSNIRVANYVEPGSALPGGLEGLYAVPKYSIECLDRALEIRARFEFTVQEWDEKPEFFDEGDPNSGIQSAPGATPPSDDEGDGSPLNDFWDWADFSLNGIDFVGSGD